MLFKTLAIYLMQTALIFLFIYLFFKFLMESLHFNTFLQGSINMLVAMIIIFF